MSNDLTCYRHNSRGTLERCDDPDILFRCDECDSEVKQPRVEEIAGMDDGPLAQLCQKLLDEYAV